MKHATAALTTLTLAFGLGACASPAAQQARQGDNRGYVAGDGTVTELPAAERSEPIAAAGVDTSGAPVDLTTWRGDVVVVNLWYAACGPCRAEAPDLVDIATEFEDDRVKFVGINTRDEPEVAAAFERKFEVPYPSMIDDDGSVITAFTGELSPQAVPTTLVLDAQGRVAARVLGRVDAGTLRALITGVVAEDAGSTESAP